MVRLEIEAEEPPRNQDVPILIMDRYVSLYPDPPQRLLARVRDDLLWRRGWRSVVIASRGVFPLRKAHGGAVMGDKGGSKDKGKREKQKKAQLSPKEKKKLKAEKKKK